MVKTSVFEKYKEYDKKIIELAIETMSSEERMNLKKGYGKNYKGVNVINKHDVASFELVDRKFKRRIEEISNLIKEGKTENEIKQKYSSTLLSSYTRKVVIPKKVSATTNYKLLPSFLDYFESTPLIQKRVEKMLDSLSKEDREVIEYYYIGSKFSILRSYYEQDNEKYQQLQSLIGRLKNEAIKQPKKETAKLVNQSTQVKTTKKETAKTNEPSKKIDDKKTEINKIDENKNPYNLLPSFISYFPSNLITTIKKIMINFSPKDKQVVGYFYSGVSFNGLRDYDINDEKFTQLNILINKIKINAIKALKEENNIIDNKDEIKNNKKQEKGLLSFFEEKDHEKVLEIIKQFETTNPKYYKLITKRYSGERFEIINNYKLTHNEYSTLHSLKNKIHKILSNSTQENKGQPFLSFFEEKDYEKVLEIVKQFETTAPGYYKVITKRYSGERFEIINQKLTDEENSLLSVIRKKIKKLLENPIQENKGQPFLSFFEEKDHEKVLEIIEQFKITNQVYYKVITKRYSGERFEIISEKLSEEEHIILGSIKQKIKKLLSSQIQENKKQSKSFLSFFEEKDHEKVLEIINQFKITNPSYYEIITKRYSGERFEIINECKLTQKENANLYNAKNRIKSLLLNPVVENKKQGFLDFFEEKDHEKVLEIVKQFKTTNPVYYEMITKRYSGERFEIINNVKLTDKEKIILNNSRKRIKELLISNKIIILEKKKERFLDFFEEKDHEKVLEIINQFKITNPEYYGIIIKRYSGERFEIINECKLTRKDYNNLYRIRNKIKKILLNPVVEKKKQGFLDFFEEKDHEKVLEIINQFKITNPSYYEIITKRYSGERFEIINECKLTQKDNVNLNNAKNRIKKILLNPVVEKRKQGFLDFFEEKDHEKVLEIVKQFETTAPGYYKVITKRYSGERFEIINKCKLTQKDNVNLNNAKNRIKKILLNPVVEKKKQGFLDFFEEKDHEEVLEIVERFKKQYPQYYEIITKKYSGKKFEIINDVKLTQKEYNILNNAKKRIRKNLLGTSHDKKGKRFLDFFEEKDHEKVLEIVKQFEITNPSYYEIITKRYSGERFEIINDGKPTQKIHSDLTMIRKEIKEMLLKQDVIESTQEKNNKQELSILEDKKSQNNKLVEKQIHIYSIQDILYILPNKATDNILMNQIIKNRQNILRFISIDEIVDCYIDNLEWFKDEDAITIIKTISMYCPDKITKIINSSYLSDKLKGLTLKEQEYIYLTLRSYSNKFLTKDVISEMLDIDKKELEKYEIMSQYDDVNKLNILFK